MSWHFLQGEEAVSSEAISWDGAVFVPSKSKTSLGKFSLPDNGTESCPASPSGMTLRRSTEGRGKDGLMWYQGDSPVRTYLPPEKGKESKGNDQAYGPKWHGSLVRYNPHLYSWRTRRCSLFEVWVVFSETWPRWGMMHVGECWALSMPELPTIENASGYWPTPRCQMTRPVKVRTDQKNGHKCNLEEVVAVRQIYPTPVKYDSTPGGPGNHYQGLGWMARHNPSKLSGGGKIQRKWDTPCKEDAHPRAYNRKKGYSGEGQKHLQAQIYNLEGGQDRGQLNPDWTEWLMGWPMGWTALQPLETDKFQQWLSSHGKFLARD